MCELALTKAQSEKRKVKSAKWKAQSAKWKRKAKARFNAPRYKNRVRWAKYISSNYTGPRMQRLDCESKCSYRHVI